MSISVLGISFDAHDGAGLADLWAQALHLTRLGARRIRSPTENDDRWISFLDPEDNEVDLVATG